MEGLKASSYGELHTWSVENRDLFWERVIRFLDIQFCDCSIWILVHIDETNAAMSGGQLILDPALEPECLCFHTVSHGGNFMCGIILF